eukprot:TRINITY_DN10104_c0_g1_i2.p1 TRINITY_DN10104_c0_g1~~TRINITY_DN10104_c0_g1_i2.p1  ORF type:complete len:213 (-),score=20.91 TRINITY_DN10104_c0_g1_i2:76-714(-)
MGGDPDFWQTTTLSILITSITFDSRLVLVDSFTGQLLGPNTFLHGNRADMQNNHTMGLVDLRVPAYWSGTSSFTFIVIDSLNKSSTDIRTVSISIQAVNQPPISRSYNITVPQNYCALSPPCPIDLAKSVQIQAWDIDSSEVKLYWEAVGFSNGKLISYKQNSLNTTIAVEDTGPYSNKSFNFTYWFQPDSSKTPNCDATGQQCSLFARTLR